MNIDVRKYIIDNFKGDDIENLRASIVNSISMNNDEPLIGLGVFFEILWNNIDDKSIILNCLHKEINK